ncbi:molybdopterin molybdotransferase MoeA [Aurantibacter crassamenti]|uniref:molybdopterin molybdotransferase MoeA n=1 Tax=Aurantibacter crassamenti TaxID=1837375 RepID=UPI00193A72ED|nr:molybdopterin molybdotransferase MoeA [Aurantibacter crassamenti]MBM1106682.1 molybdopterin molybdotransferase MoeA [Aurantibacter crassamenti]
MENSFITYQQALAILDANVSNFNVETKNIEACIGHYLAEDLIADRAFPPFDRVTMDGIAILHEQFKNGQREFKIEAVAPAGSPQKTLQEKQNCIEVMTGAILPFGVDTVIRYEDLILDEEKQIATIDVDALKFKQNIHFKGIDIAQGTSIVPKGIQLSSAEINIAASIGKASLKVVKLPKMVLFSTGDELIPIHETPELHQIRRSNVYGIQATLKEWGINAELQHLPDDKATMLKIISAYLKQFDVLIFTGGVSKGKFDYLPEVLETLKVKKHFHKIQQRPGKPFWFGTNAAGKKIFALPGNPVSSFVCTYVYIQYWLAKSLRIPQKPLFVQLKKDIKFSPNLVYFLEATLESTTKGTLVADPQNGNGSGDFVNLVKTDGLLILPQDKSEFKKGEVYPFLRYRRVF